MKRLLMRGAISPIDTPASINNVIVKNLIGTNSGNLLYAFAVYRTLMTEDVEIDVDHYDCEGGRWTDEDIDYINETYDAYIVPLADAFRLDFRTKLKRYAKAFRKLRIPSYIIGVGIRASYEPELSEGFPFDDAVKDFISSAVENGGTVGLRGEITAEYLQRLGFMPERDFTVIGCPSMYAFGRELKQKSFSMSGNMRISVNYENDTEEPVARLLFEIAMQSNGGQFVGQSTADLTTYFVGKTYPGKISSEYYPAGITHELYRQNKVHFFSTATEWFANMRTIDLSIGTRLHGNVAALLGGTPAVFLPHDARTRELAAYHNLPSYPSHLVGEETTLSDILASVELQSGLKVQGGNFDRFIDFLDEHHLDHIYKDDRGIKEAPLDQYIAEWEDRDKEVTSALFCSREELIDRVLNYQESLTRRQVQQSESRLKEQINQKEKQHKKELSEIKKQIQELKAAQTGRRNRRWAD